MDISNMYLNTPLDRFKYIHVPYSNFPPDIIEHYNLASKVAADEFIYIEIRQTIYGLKQTDKLANQQLKKVLATRGYFPSKYTPGLYLRKTSPISFTLVVDDFGVKYVNKQDALHLEKLISDNFPMKSDWNSTQYTGINLK